MRLNGSLFTWAYSRLWRLLRHNGDRELHHRFANRPASKPRASQPCLSGSPMAGITCILVVALAASFGVPIAPRVKLWQPGF